jgi:hypothetical protein
MKFVKTLRLCFLRHLMVRGPEKVGRDLRRGRSDLLFRTSHLSGGEGLLPGQYEANRDTVAGGFVAYAEDALFPGGDYR